MTTPGPELRISDREREAAVTALGEHYASGRLTKEEYDERAATAFEAKTSSALKPLFSDLPAPHPFAGASRAGSASGTSSGSQPGPRRQPGSWAPRSPMAASRSRTGFRMPMLPLLFVLIGLAILLSAPWLVFVGLGALIFAKSRRGSWAHGCGSSYRAHGSSS